jgi:hypothetical protein
MQLLIAYHKTPELNEPPAGCLTSCISRVQMCAQKTNCPLHNCTLNFYKNSKNIVINLNNS